MNHRLGSEGRTFSFFQAVTLLEEYFKKKQGDADPISNGRIRFTASSSVSFPSSDIEKIEAQEHLVQFTLTFMGLCGVSSPLPYYFSEYIAHFDKENPALGEFLAIFNHRIYSLFYRAWKKYRFAVDKSENIHRLACLAGLAREKTRSIKDKSHMLAYTGILAGKCRSAAGLKAMLSHHFGGISVSVQEWVAQWTPVGVSHGIGNSARLGVNLTVGTHVFDIAGKFRVVVGPLARSQFEQFVPGSANAAEMKKMISEYIVDPLNFDIEVKLAALDLIPVMLGENNGRLGVTSSLGKSGCSGGAYSIILD